MDQMTEHFTLSELTHSVIAKAKGIDNTPDDEVIEQLRFTAAGLERVRAFLAHPLIILSGFRCVILNTLVNGSKESQHIVGEAADFVCPSFGSPRQTFLILSLNMQALGIDQLINESTWTHVSFTLNPRHEALTFKDGVYLRGV